MPIGYVSEVTEDIYNANKDIENNLTRYNDIPYRIMLIDCAEHTLIEDVKTISKDIKTAILEIVKTKSLNNSDKNTYQIKDFIN